LCVKGPLYLDGRVAGTPGAARTGPGGFEPMRQGCKVVIHEDRGPGRLSWTADRYARILEHNGIHCARTHLVNRDFWQTAGEADLFIFRYGLGDYDQQIGDVVLPLLTELMNVKCFPGTSARLLYEDKVRQTLLLEALGFNTPRTWVFFDREAAFEFLRSAEYPLVFKLRKGAAAKSVALLR